MGTGRDPLGVTPSRRRGSLTPLTCSRGSTPPSFRTPTGRATNVCVNDDRIQPLGREAHSVRRQELLVLGAESGPMR